MFNFKQWFLKEMQVMILPVHTMKKMGIHDMLPPDHPTAKHGIYVDKNKFDSADSNLENIIINGNYYKSGKILAGYIDSSGTKHPPEFKVYKKINIANLKDLKKSTNKLIRVNMITNSPRTGMKWSPTSTTKLDKNYYQITSIALGALHHFCLACYFTTPFNLSTYEKSEPRSKPTTYGNLQFGEIVGKINLMGREKDLYDKITITQ